jgi:hypothetical protein
LNLNAFRSNTWKTKSFVVKDMLPLVLNIKKISVFRYIEILMYFKKEKIGYAATV